MTDDWTDEQIYAAMIENPKVMQRPIGINGNKAVLGRPNEKLLDIV
ncbi:MAG: ArsC/Spx/MgsR family protein [Pseudomonadota bacterium]